MASTSIDASAPYPSPEPSYGVFKFSEPDLTVTANDRSFFAIPASKEWEQVSLPLFDYRTDPFIIKGFQGLDAHGFTVVQHESSLSGDAWFEGSNLEDVYLPEVEKLVKDLTGCKSVVCDNAAFRRKPARKQADPEYYVKRNDPESMDNLIKQGKMTVDGVFIVGKSRSSSREPARSVHCDYTLRGLNNIIRFSNRPTIAAVASEAIEALKYSENSRTPYRGPRYAAYSIWRPVKTVRRDPIAVAAWKSIASEDFVKFDYRAPTERAESEYVIEALSVKPANGGYASHRWYWLPMQKPDEVMVLKLADSESEVRKGEVAPGVAHGNPILSGTENEDARESIEVRVLAFW